MFQVLYVVAFGVLLAAKQIYAEYLGPQQSKPYFFPWLVRFLRRSPTGVEFFGSGSILTRKWVIGSMDCFVRPIPGRRQPYYATIADWEVHSGGIWANPWETRRGWVSDSQWTQKRKVAEVRIFSGVPSSDKLTTLVFTAGRESPVTDLNAIAKSPFGFAMSVALVLVRKFPGSGGSDGWDWKRQALPIPLLSDQPSQVKWLLDVQLKYFEKTPLAKRCHIGGWRTGDGRLIEHEVVYVPFHQCREIYCSYDDRACDRWPVNGTHVCFKSLTFIDPCWRDQGSALYCRTISDTALGILTSAPTCGYDGLPGVFTLIYHGLDLLGRVSSDRYKPIPEDEKKKYTPPPEDQLIPAY